MENTKKPLLKFDMKYTEKEYFKLNKFHLHCLYRYIHILIYALMFLCLSINLYFKSKLWVVIVLAIAIGLYTAAVIVSPYVLKFFNKRKNKININLIVQYKLYVDYFEVKLKDEEKYSRINFSNLYKAYETKTNFYLYINNNNAYIISKKKITGNISNFRKILKSNLNKKFVKII